MTLLTSGPAPDPEKLEAARLALRMAYDICSKMLQGYAEGEMSFHDFARSVRRALAANSDSKFERRRALGELIERALETMPAGAVHKNKRQRWLCQAAYEMVEVVGQLGYSITVKPARGKRLTAFDKVAEVMRVWGIDQCNTADSVRHHRDAHRRLLAIPGIENTGCDEA